jgi:O-methyltransferase
MATWLKNKNIQKLGGGFLERTGLAIWSAVQLGGLAAHKDPAVVKMLRQIHRDRRSLMSAFELFNVYGIGRAQARRPGAFAEVGVFRGASAKLLCEVKGDKPLHLFDTFEGLPPETEHDRGVHWPGQFACSLESVQAYLAGYANVHFHKGIFPDSAAGVPEMTYALAHFDVDLYEGTRACLEYFYPRMVPGGIILSHDYDILAGVNKAFNEFFADKPEAIIEQPTTQCIVVKLGS